MRARKVYACEGCGEPVIRPNRTDRRKYCTPCAANAVAANAYRLHVQRLVRLGLMDAAFLPPPVKPRIRRSA